MAGSIIYIGLQIRVLQYIRLFYIFQPALCTNLADARTGMVNTLKRQVEL